MALTDRQMDTDTRRGLLGTPSPVSLGKHGRAPAMYSSDTRLLYGVVLDHRAQATAEGKKANDRMLALLVIHAWLHFGEHHVPLEQVQRAAKTAVGNRRRSDADAERNARAIVKAIDIHGALPHAAAALRKGLVLELTSRAPRRAPLAPLVAAVFEPDVRWGRQRIRQGENLREPLPLGRVRGPGFAQLSVAGIVDSLWMKMFALQAVGAGRASDAQWRRAREMFHSEWRVYEQAPSAYEAPEDLAAVYADERGPLSSPELALDTLLVNLGLVLARRTCDHG